MTAEVAPEVLVSFAECHTKARRYIARKPHEIHPGRPDLPVMQTASGLWISKNIGRHNLNQALGELCRVLGMRFRKDLIFPLQDTAQ